MVTRSVGRLVLEVFVGPCPPGMEACHNDGDPHNNWLDNNGHPGTEALRLTERLHRRDYGHIDFQMTVDDPKAYTRPWTVKLPQTLAVDTDLLDYFCLDNEKDTQHMPK